MAKIRELNPDDTESVLETLNSSDSGLRRVQMASVPGKLLDSFRERRMIYAAEEESVLCGLVCFVTGPVFAGGGIIAFLNVPRDKRGRGIGRQLVGFAERKVLQQTDRVFVTVPVEDESAQKFFEHRGYRKVGSVKASEADQGHWILRKDSENPSR